jgi:rubrerythrin
MKYSLPEFLAMSIALERETEERYIELADMMEAHLNHDTAKVFRDMARFSKLHGDEISERAKDVELPKLKSWEYRWRAPAHEVGDDEGIHYLMTPYHALTYARENEIRGRDFYRTAAEQGADEEVRRLGNEFAAEEQEHVEALDHWIEKTPRPSLSWMEDPDPVRSQ